MKNKDVLAEYIRTHDAKDFTMYMTASMISCAFDSPYCDNLGSCEERKGCVNCKIDFLNREVTTNLDHLKTLSADEAAFFLREGYWAEHGEDSTEELEEWLKERFVG